MAMPSIGTPFINRCRRRDDGKYDFYTELYNGECSTVPEMMPELNDCFEFHGQKWRSLLNSYLIGLAVPKKIVTPRKYVLGEPSSIACHLPEIWEEFFDIVKNHPKKLPVGLRKALKPQN